MNRQRIFEALLRRDFFVFLQKVFATLHPDDPPLERSPYLMAVCHVMILAFTGEIRRHAINIPPRHLKSITVAVAFPAFVLGHRPSAKILVAAYSEELSRKHAKDFRTIVQSDWYRRLFPERVIDRGSDRQLEVVTTRTGARRAVSVGGTLTGLGADYIIIDDCMKAEDIRSAAVKDGLRHWYENTLLTRRNDPANGVVISISQRLSEDDLTAYLLEKGYGHLNLPAIADERAEIPIGDGEYFVRAPGDLLFPTRFTQAVLDEFRRELGPQIFSAQFQQNPVTPEGNLIRMEWFGEYEGVIDPKHRHRWHKIVQSWDTAETATPTSDWSVCHTWGYRDGHWFLLDVYRAREEYPDLKRSALRLRQLWKPERILIEAASVGRALAQELRKEHQCLEVKGVTPRGDKQTRVVGITGQLESGRFLLPVDAPFLRDFRSELRAFPTGSRHDDQVDALAQFVKFQFDRRGWVEEEYTSTGRPTGSNRPRGQQLNRRY